MDLEYWSCLLLCGVCKSLFFYGQLWLCSWIQSVICRRLIASMPVQMEIDH